MAISPRKLRNDVYSYTYQNDSNTPLVISVLASLMERTLARNERIGRKYGANMSSKIRVFDCYETPDMTIQSYLERIFKYTKAGPSVYVVAYVYIDRFCRSQPEFRITGRNVHRLLITTIMVASKYVEDMNYRNSYFARVGGITTKEMNSLELDFLFMMNFKMHVNAFPGGGAEMTQFDDLKAVIGSVSLTDQRDTWQWSLDVAGGFSVASARAFVDDTMLEADSVATRWNRTIPIKVNVFLWRLHLNKLPSMMAKDLWSLLAKWWDLDIPICANISEWYDWLDVVRVAAMARSALEVRLRALRASGEPVADPGF
ncbi:cyclin-like protein [Tanacetum coccineum]